MTSSPFSRGTWPASYGALYNSSNPTLQNALRGLDGYAENLERLEAISAALDEITSRPLAIGSLREALTDRVLRDVAQGRLEVDGLIDQARSVVADDRLYGEARTALIAAGSRVVEAIDRTTESSSDTLLAHLNDELRRLLSSVAPGQLFTGTAEAAIASGSTVEYETTAALAEEHKSIRGAQRLIMSKLGGVLQFNDVNLPGLYFRQVLGVFPGYARWRVEGGYISAPFPDLNWNLDNRSVLKWSVDHPEAEAWIPTLSQFANITDELDQAVADYSNDRRAARLDEEADVYGRTTA